MVNSIASKTATKALTPKPDELKGPDKSGPGKFDQVRAKLQDTQASQIQLPPQNTQISPHQKKLLETDLRKKLDGSRTKGKDVFKVDMKNAQTGIDKLNSQVNALPKTNAFSPLRSRMEAIEKQFQDSGKLADGLGKNSNPRDLMQVQLQMYQLNENISIMSKVVDQVNSGIKSILQTQI